jgi:hypothetical protein
MYEVNFKRKENPIQCIVHELERSAFNSDVPIELIPAPEAGEFTQLLGITTIYKPGTIPVGVLSDNLYLTYGIGGNTIPGCAFSMETLFSEGAPIFMCPDLPTDSYSRIGVENLPVMANIAATPESGNGKLKVIVWFIQHEIGA